MTLFIITHIIFILFIYVDYSYKPETLTKGINFLYKVHIVRIEVKYIYYRILLLLLIYLLYLYVE